MFHRLEILALFAASTFFASSADAQGADWDRRVSSVDMIHPPGTPPGTYTVRARIEAGVNDTVPSGSNLSMDVTVTLNGIPISVATLNEEVLQVIQCLIPNSGGVCDLGASCSSWLYQGNLYPGICNYITLPLLVGCTCWNPQDYHYIPNGLMRPTDLIGVTISASPGALPELVTSNDSITVLVGEFDPATPFCSGDGTLPTPCPCANNGASGHGCANSANPSGALLQATGFTEVDPLTGTDNVVLHGSGMPATSSAIYLKSDGDNGTGVTFGDGVSCLTGSIIRLRTKINVGGASQFPEPGDPSLSVRGATPSGSGLTGWYQVFYRNAAAAYCPPATHNISGGLRIDW